MSQVYILLPAGTTIRKAAGAAGYTTPIKVAQAVVQAVEYEPWLWMGWGQWGQLLSSFDQVYAA